MTLKNINIQTTDQQHGEHPEKTIEQAPQITQITFADLQLSEPIQRALREKNYVHPSPIQAKAIPHLIQGHDMIGSAQTGSGKTAAFALPILHRLNVQSQKPLAAGQMRVLVVTPTRELAAQILQSFQHYGKYLKLSYAVVFGGVGQRDQVRALSRGVDVLIATPGRLLDLEEQRYVRFDSCSTLVLDEADRMLDMGFAPDLKKILSKLPEKRQSLLFSATMPKAIEELAHRMLKNPVRIDVAPASVGVGHVQQQVCQVEQGNKHKLLLHLLEKHTEGLVLVFMRMKHSADRLVDQLARANIRAEALHANKSQNARTYALRNFSSGRVRVLVATDIAARGIDVKDIRLVVNFDLPQDSESYMHRIGRTARAGAEGLAISFCDQSERFWLHNIERSICKKIDRMSDHPFVQEQTEVASSRPRMRRSSGPRWGRSNRSSRSSEFRSEPSGRRGGFSGRNSRSERTSSFSRARSFGNRTQKSSFAN